MVHVGAVMQNDICRSSSFPFASQTAAALDSCSFHAAMLSAAAPWTGHCSPYPACCRSVSPAFGLRMGDEDRTRQFVSPSSSGQSRNQPLAPCRLGLSSVRARPLPAWSDELILNVISVSRQAEIKESLADALPEAAFIALRQGDPTVFVIKIQGLCIGDDSEDANIHLWHKNGRLRSKSFSYIDRKLRGFDWVSFRPIILQVLE